ncbi:hypothetical protein BCR41DRAFT_145349 [Lobosporangium transversale]|uniref:Uncharacterized protein n=1 Tax=Lobosporangium transversale TaxID=64571 RepID=A0A1Y2GEB3_9FUNG|nr:hypothetical protein BCR41DRAFT_145349 [Lobosporangium transversale]ORZ08509.1 hypothetical protein BCR41DRAFT_145349 [Lobosporangium transversale]|eukprot:XP_021878437.1 hypothetical protein BCR41DRAFT_145349 [Lobosporangium transversale]
MGIEGLWSFLLKTGYEATLHYHSLICATSNPFNPFNCNAYIRFDVLGTLHPIIQNAYSNHSLDTAHKIMERELGKYGTPENLILYLDGDACEEKKHTHIYREEVRAKALMDAQQGLDELYQRVQSKSRVRKEQFVAVIKALDMAFHWSKEARESFAKYMRLIASSRM